MLSILPCILLVYTAGYIVCYTAEYTVVHCRCSAGHTLCILWVYWWRVLVYYCVYAGHTVGNNAEYTVYTVGK